MTGTVIPVPVVCAIIEQGGRFLAALRSRTQSNALLWEFPGGKVMAGEDAETAIARELKEELGIAVETTGRLASRTHHYPWMTIELIPVICTIARGTPLAHEHEEIRWIDKTEALTLEWAPADVPVLEEYLGNLWRVRGK